MKPKLTVLPPAQLALWPNGGTAVALQLGHRESVDFDFFSAMSLDRNKLLNEVPLLQQGKMVQPEINTLDCYLEMLEGGVKLQFLAGLGARQGKVQEPQQCEDNGIYIASLRDLLATKLNTIQMRAEIKDYLDIDAMLRHGLSLSDGLACARAIYVPSFDPGTSIRALCSYRDGNLPELSKSVCKRLTNLALLVDKLPEVTARSETI